MLADPRADALVTNFAGQWLYLRNLAVGDPDPRLFPDFDDNLRQAFRRETELFFESIMREDRSVLDLLRADYTFVNERLAKHYGIPNVYGSHFRRVTLADGQPARRAARAGQHPDGDVVRQPHVAGAARQVDAREPPRHCRRRRRRRTCRRSRSGTPAARCCRCGERMAQHRANPACAGCHQLMDPIGLATRELRRRGTLADASKERRAGRCVRRAARRQRRSTASPGSGGAAAPRRSCSWDADREAADLCARPRPRAVTMRRRCAPSSAPAAPATTGFHR